MSLRSKREDPPRQTPAGPDGVFADHSVSRLVIPAICILLAEMVWVVFGQTLRFEFLHYDDDQYVFENPMVRGGLTPGGIAWAFTHVDSDNWHPLTTISQMLDCQVYGLKPWGHHLTNVLLHMAGTILLFLVLRRMTGALLRSAFVAAVFAVHPLHVESVVWVSERKDVLSGVFFMLTLGAYAHYAREPASRVRYFAVIAMFALGLMCKPTLVTLPFVLLLLDYWPLRRFTEEAGGRHVFSIPLRLIMEKIPLFALSVCSCVATLLAQEKAYGAVEKLSFPDQIGNALVSYMVYLGEMIFPAGLVVLYPHPANNLPVWEVLLAVLLLASISAGVFAWRRNHPFLLVGWLWYLGVLVPMIGLVQVGPQAHADRYTYLSQIGLYIAVAWMAAGLCARLPHLRVILCAVAVLVVARLAWCARIQTSYWRNTESLWMRTLACTSDNAPAHNHLGAALASEGQFDEAIKQYLEALRLKPGYAEAWSNLGSALFQEGQTDNAITQYQKSLAIEPKNPLAHYNLGVALIQEGRDGEALLHFQKALDLAPGNADAHDNLGNILFREGRKEEAIIHFKKAIELNPYLEEAHNNLGFALFDEGRTQEAITHYRKALELNPGSADVHYNLGLALSSENQLDEAIIHYQKAIELKPNFTDALDNLGLVLLRNGRSEEAVAFYLRALKIEPDNPKVQTNLAWLLATSPQDSLRDGGQAVELAQQANRTTKGGNPIVLGTLAAAYAETERFGLAEEIAKRALELANSQSNTALANLLRSQIMHYQAKTPFRDNGSRQ